MPAEIVLTPLPLTKERFAPYGEVIETATEKSGGMNDARFDRFDNLCNIEIADGDVMVSIARSRTASELPLRIDMVERHPLGSQAFIPLSQCRIIVVVAPPAESVEAADLKAFETNGKQGINYRRGTWHMPLVAFESGQRYLIIDRDGQNDNCDIHYLDTAILLQQA